MPAAVASVENVWKRRCELQYGGCGFDMSVDVMTSTRIPMCTPEYFFVIRRICPVRVVSCRRASVLAINPPFVVSAPGF